MNAIQLRMTCVEIASKTARTQEGVIPLAKDLFDWVTQGAWPSDIPPKENETKIAA